MNWERWLDKALATAAIVMFALLLLSWATK